jgi:hypothetical protein
MDADIRNGAIMLIMMMLVCLVPHARAAGIQEDCKHFRRLALATAQMRDRHQSARDQIRRVSDREPDPYTREQVLAMIDEVYHDAYLKTLTSEETATVEYLLCVDLRRSVPHGPPPGWRPGD